MQVLFQRVTQDDVGQLKEIALKTFFDSYFHLNTPTNFECYVDKAFRKNKLLSEIQNENSFFHFVTNRGNIIGYLKMNIGDSQTEHFDHTYLEIERIYLDARFQHKGIGYTMLQFALRQAKAFSKSKIWLGVWDKNPKAIKFYRKNGFRETGSHIFRFGDEDQTDIIMERDV